MHPHSEPSRAPERQRRALVADDEESMRYFVRRALERAGFEVTAVDNGTAAVRCFEADDKGFDVVVLDLKMPGADGIETYTAIAANSPDVPTIIMTGHGTISSAVEAMSRGVFTYITKPFEAEELLLHVDRAVVQRATALENLELRRQLDHRSAYGGLIGTSPAMQSVYQAIDLLADSDATVLISGESGTGKEIVARAIHARSNRAQLGRFVPLPCSTLQKTLADSQLFGSLPGSFTGAREKREGVFGRAAGGTLFVDEISELDHELQPKLERVLQEREYTPLGGASASPMTARIIAATSRDLVSLVETGEFRRELFFRLNVVPISVPPLRDHSEDIPQLVSHFAERLRGSASDPVEFTDDAMWHLTQHAWPGNVRELQNVIERTVALAGSESVIDVEHLPLEFRSPTSAELTDGLGESTPAAQLSPYHQAIASAERRFLSDLLRRSGGNITQAARLAGLSRGHLHRKLRALHLDPGDFRTEA